MSVTHLNVWVLPEASGKTLVIPEVLLADQATFSIDEQTRTNLDKADDQVCGWLQWRRIMIPIISLERICEDAYQAGEAQERRATLGRDRLFAILYNLQPAAKNTFFAIPLSSNPEAMRISSDDLKIENILAAEGDGLCAVFPQHARLYGRRVSLLDPDVIAQIIQSSDPGS